MLIALNNNNKERVSIKDALINEKYFCPLCKEELILKKGLIRCHHFAHKSNSICFGSKYSDMCEWHINWQNRFPKDTIEIVKIDENGKKHIADVLIKNTEIEFQHSYMPFEEFNDRNEFYHKFNYRVIWIFDGNDVFAKGYNMGPFPFSKKFDCLKKIKNIPDYVDIFIEGKIEYNLLTDYGLYLHHVNKIDEKTGIIFDGKCTIEEFIYNVNNNINFRISEDIDNYEKESINNNVLPQTILSISNKYPNAKFLVWYNTLTKYCVLLDKYNIKRLKDGKKIYGKIKSHKNYGEFDGNTTEIYYSKDPVWIYQIHYN